MDLWRGQVPGKVFLLGEYAALFGQPALVATLPQFFELSQSSLLGGAISFHGDSPLGKLLRSRESCPRARQLLSQFQFKDPFCGEGGFGASTAQFALGYAFLEAPEPAPFWLGAWRAYRSLHQISEVSSATATCLPSGADLVAQVVGGVIVFEWKDEPTVESLSFSGGVAPHCLIFSATSDPRRKVATHSHLAGGDLLARFETRDGKRALAQLDLLVRAGRTTWLDGDVKSFGEIASEYGDCLSAVGLECSAAQSDRKAFQALEGVLGVKGTGALQSDGLLVVVEEPIAGPNLRSGARGQKRVIELAAERGLKLVAAGIGPVPGLTVSGQLGADFEGQRK